MATKIGIAGGGIGGLASAIALDRIGLEVEVYEQAPAYARIGSGITLTPNAVKVLDRIGVGEAVSEIGYVPQHRLNRQWDTGEVFSSFELGATSEARYGRPLLTYHRSDVLKVLEDAVPAGVVRFDHRVADVQQDDAGVTVSFANGGTAAIDVLIAADGIHSQVREVLFGREEHPPAYTGMVGYRWIIPSDQVDWMDHTPFVKWWGPPGVSQITHFPIGVDGEEMFVFAAVGQPEWTEESWTLTGDAETVEPAFRDYHDDARRLIESCGPPLQTALYDREPMSRWTAGRVALLGDACHPMTPFMAQGGASALEDVAMLQRAIEASTDEWAATLERYEASRRERVDQIQMTSHANKWGTSRSDADWVYGYDVWSASL